MYHLASVFLFLPLLTFFYGTQGWRGWWQLTMVSAIAAGIVLSTFVAAYWWAGHDWVGHEQRAVEGFISWVVAITDHPLTDWGSLSNWRPTGLGRAGWSQMKTITLLPDYLMFDQGSLRGQIPLVIIGALVVSAALLWNAIQIMRRVPPALARVYFLLLFATNFLFFTWWDPDVHKFYIPSLIPLIILISLTLRDMYMRATGRLSRRLIGGTVTALIALVFVFNLFSILELRRSRGPAYAEAEILNRLAPGRCRIYSHGPHLGPLGLYFGRYDNVYIPLLEEEFYRVKLGQPLAEGPIIKDEDCAFIPLGLLSEQRYEKSVGRYLDTASWPDYVAYVLDVKDASGNDSVTYNSFKLAEGGGLPYLLIDRRRRVQGRDLDQMTGMIRTAVSHALRELKQAYPEEKSLEIFWPRQRRTSISVGIGV